MINFHSLVFHCSIIYIFLIIKNKIFFPVPQNPEKDLLCSLGRKWVYQRIKRSCKKKMVYKRIPIAAWIQTYRKDYIVSDLVAGITVGLTVIPQAIAYANVAGLPLQVRMFILLSFQVLFKYHINILMFIIFYTYHNFF